MLHVNLDADPGPAHSQRRQATRLRDRAEHLAALRLRQIHRAPAAARARKGHQPHTAQPVETNVNHVNPAGRHAPRPENDFDHVCKLAWTADASPPRAAKQPSARGHSPEAERRTGESWPNLPVQRLWRSEPEAGGPDRG